MKKKFAFKQQKPNFEHGYVDGLEYIEHGYVDVMESEQLEGTKYVKIS